MLPVALSAETNDGQISDPKDIQKSSQRLQRVII